MFGLLLAALLLLVALAAITLRKTYYYLTPKELKRQAEAGDKLAVTLYRAVAYGESLRALLWIVIGLASAGGFLMLAHLAPPVLGLVLIAVLLWLAFSWLPNTRVTAVGARLAAWSTPAIVWVLNYTHPLLGRLAEPLHRHYQDGHSGLYEASDLLELVERQAAQGDNRMSPQQLEAVRRTLTAHQYKVGDVLVPRSQVKSVNENDTVGLVLLDELHASGQSSFPVKQARGDKIIGSLYLDDLNLKTEGSVRDYMHKDVRYLHEDDSLEQALQAFYKTKHQLFVVVNSFEEYLGIATLEHVMQQLTGDVADDGFDQHGDLAAVANKHVHDDDEPEPEAEAVPAPEETETEETIEEPVIGDEPELAEEPVDEPEVEPEPETEESDEEPAEDEEQADHEEVEALSMEDESDEPAPTDLDELAALDLPDEESIADDPVGTHVTFEKPKKAKSKAKKPEPETPEPDDEVVDPEDTSG